ncbi:ATP-binding protein [Polaribacter sp. MSW13]|uniref:histidine kinase n=1 Tax=Polaribacter marinus TaxID=2916838 RepID=A0A9X1VK63_9FLAO|nr:ATP-binding protein [Polaribacter marinus]MCI2227631.1 ATP-binding protein [Polaribacter marinus]
MINNTTKIFKKTILVIVLLISGSVMISWFLDIEEILSVISDSATMKFNTALLFFLTSFCLIIENKKGKKSQSIYFILTGIILLIGTLSILEHGFQIDLAIDNLFVKDQISKNSPGRMSVATSLCFTLLGIGFLGLKTRKIQFKKISQSIVLITMFIAFISAITYVLKIPAENKTFFFETMAIHTSLLFLFSSSLIALKTPNIGFIKLLFSKLNGSSLLRKMIPFILLIPFLLSYFLSDLIHKNIIEYNFGIIIYTVILILISIIYTSIISFGLNKSDYKRRALDQNIISKNEELIQYKIALNSVTALTITDNKGVIKTINDNLTKMTQYTEKELLGNDFSLFYSDHYEPSFFENILAVLNNGTIWEGELQNLRKDGTTIWVSCSIIPFKNEHGTIEEFVVLKQDISKRKKAEALLESQYVKQLEAKNKELEQFTYIASHDLQEPLRTVTSFSDILSTEYQDKLDEQAKISFKFIKQATSRMSSLIKALLDYSRLGYEQKLTTINCNTLIDNITKDLNTTISQTNTKIEAKKLPELKGYETAIRLLFQNLITNAIKFRQKDRSPIIKISAKQKGNIWEFCVEDNGIGIAKEFQKKIFAIFQRLHLKDEYEGTGIGLAHCQKIANLHGGEIWVESSPMKGSKFYFTILNE